MYLPAAVTKLKPHSMVKLHLGGQCAIGWLPWKGWSLIWLTLKNIHALKKCPSHSPPLSLSLSLSPLSASLFSIWSLIFCSSTSQACVWFCQSTFAKCYIQPKFRWKLYKFEYQFTICISAIYETPKSQSTFQSSNTMPCSLVIFYPSAARSLDAHDFSRTRSYFHWRPCQYTVLMPRKLHWVTLANYISFIIPI